MADLLEHLYIIALPTSTITLLREGIALLRDTTITDSRLIAYAGAAWTAVEAAWAAEAPGAAAAEQKWQTERFIESLEDATNAG